MAIVAASALVLLCIPDAAFARGGGGRASSGTSRVGPAGRGSVGRTRTRASGRGDMIRDTESGGDQRHSSADSRRERAADRAADRARDGDRVRPKPLPARWPRRRGGRRYTVVEFQDLSCGKSERVDGVSYFYCDGAWYERVYEGGEVYWVEVENPGG